MIAYEALEASGTLDDLASQAQLRRPIDPYNYYALCVLIQNSE